MQPEPGARWVGCPQCMERVRVPQRREDDGEPNGGLSAIFTGYRPLALVGIALVVLVLCIGVAVFRQQHGLKPDADAKPPVVQAQDAMPFKTPTQATNTRGANDQSAVSGTIPARLVGLPVADEKYCLQVAALIPHLAGLVQIPATVIDKGVLRNVPYKSYRAGDYELNIYGDPDQPAGIEIGVYRDLLTDKKAKQNCVEFITSVLPASEDQKFLGSLNLAKDMVVHGDLTIEVTPPTDEDAYGGWWVSAYRLGVLDQARASEVELAQISVPRKEVQANPANTSEWAMADLKLARPSAPLPQPPVQYEPAPQPPVQYQPVPVDPHYAPSKSSGGSVYVRGYTRKDGTYVHSYTRRR